jgi:hypothetical protein
MPYVTDSEGNCINQEYIPHCDRAYFPHRDSNKYVLHPIDIVIGISIISAVILLIFIAI